MTQIVIVEDRLKNALRIAEQLQKWLVEEQKSSLELKKILLFNPSEEKVEKEKRENSELINRLELVVEPVCLWNFNEKLDEYMNDAANITFYVMDFLLEEDGSGGIPEYRVNIRYARRQTEDKKKRLFFYTLTGTENYNLLCGLVGSDQVLPSKYEKMKLPCLDLQKANNFRIAIQEVTSI